MIRNSGPQATRDEVIQHAAPGGFTFSAHIAHGQQNLLSIAANAENDQQRDTGGLAVEPHAHHAAIEAPVRVALLRSGRTTPRQQTGTLSTVVLSFPWRDLRRGATPV